MLAKLICSLLAALAASCNLFSVLTSKNVVLFKIYLFISMLLSLLASMLLEFIPNLKKITAFYFIRQLKGCHLIVLSKNHDWNRKPKVWLFIQVILFFFPDTVMCRCGYNQEVPNSIHPPYTDGVLGLGSGKASIVAQLSEMGLTRNVVGHCLSGQGGGFLFFGDDFLLPSEIVWAPILSQT